MKNGKIFLLVFIVLFSGIGLILSQDLISDENHSSIVDTNVQQVKNIQIKVSDGIGTDSKG